jgi:hypothetical protein
MSGNKIDKKEIIAAVRSVREKMRITKVTCTRKITSRDGDTFLAWSMETDSVAEDSNTALDAVPDNAMTYREAQLATLVLAGDVDKAAIQNAVAAGNIDADEAESRIYSSRQRHSKRIIEFLEQSKPSS